MVIKNEIIYINICDISSKGYGICKFNNFVIFVDSAIEGDFCKIKITEVKKNYAYGKILKIIKTSKYRITPQCEIFYKCGGCSLQHVQYKTQLNIKEKKLKECLVKIGEFDNNYIDKITENIQGMETPYRYRNKAQFPVGYYNNKISIGFFSKRSHNIINCKDCLIQDKINKEILKIIYDHIKNFNIKLYDEINNTGLIRHIVTRVGFFTKEILVCLVINSNKNEKLLKSNILIENLLNIKNIKGIILNFNTSKRNKILSEDFEILWGKSYIIDYIDNIKFKISYNSFFQINPIQTKLIYNDIVKLANLNNSDIVIDAYCGIGTISLFLAKKAKKVYGIEILKSSILDAIENAKINNIDNVKFIAGKSEEIIKDFKKNNIIPNLIVLDPPRKGCHVELLKTLLNIETEQIIYMSCNSSTLARDLKILCDKKYKLEKIKIYDMFPQTYHIEVVALLVKA